MPALNGRYLVAVKTLSAVETEADRSNQHELNGSAALRQLLGEEPRLNFPTRWLFLRDDGEPFVEERACSWYDSRRNNPERSAEWRLYYAGTPLIGEGDLLVCIVREDTDEVTFLVARGGASWEKQLRGLFGDPLVRTGRFTIARFDAIPASHQSVALELFELLGWAESATDTQAPDLERLLERFGDQFPATAEFSAFARELEAGDLANPDETLLAWWRREESLFRVFEERLVQQRLLRSPPFSGVDDFVAFSLSVQNRRKSRAGRALENHVDALLQVRGVRFGRNIRTEGDRRPDFIMPGEAAYRDLSYPADQITILATKTTCKDRWRQVLNEAARVPTKHLLTLEPGISTTQLAEMHDERVVLVAPSPVHSTYSAPSGMSIMSVGDFLAQILERQRRLSQP